MALSSQSATAQVYAATGQSGAQTQIDSAPHTTTFHLTVTAPVTFGGGKLVMKRGSASTANVDFTLYADDTCSGATLATVTHGASAFTTQFTEVDFQIPGNAVLGVGVYCTTVSSSAAVQQSEAFFIKGADSCTIFPAGQADITCSSSTPIFSPNLTLSKSAPSPALTVGAQSTYTLTVTNSGTIAATTAQLKDQLPSGLTFVSASGTGWTCSNASGLLSCNYSGSIAAGGGTSSLDVTVSANAGTGGQSLVNYASVDPTGSGTPPTPGSGCSPVESCASNTSTVLAPNLSLAKSAPSPALRVGAQSTYVLTATNFGTAATTTATVKDQLPSGLTYVSSSGTGWTCSNAAGLVTCNYSGSIAASGGSSSVSITVSANAGTGGQSLTNQASIDSTGGGTPPTPGAGCSPSASCPSNTSAVAAPYLSLTKSAPSPALTAGAQSTYVLTVTNSGTAATTTAQVKDQLPSGLTYVSSSGTGWTCSNASGLVTCNYSGSIADSGGTSSVSITVSANAGTGGQSLANYASVDPTGGTSPPTPGLGCLPAGTCASNTSTVLGPNLSLAKSAPSPALTVGAQSTYVLTVTNSGSAVATTATVKDQLPTGLTYVSSTGTGWACSNTSGLVTCSYEGSIAAGGTSAVSITVSANAGTGGQSLANYASVDPTGGPSPPTPGPACSPAASCPSNTSTVSAPNLSLTKSAPSPALREGAQSTYVLTVTNSGSAAATTATVKDQLPSGLTYVSSSGTGWTCSNASGLVTCSYSGSIAAGGGTSSLNITVSTNAGAGGQSLANYASVDPTGGPSPPTPGPSCSPAASCPANTSTVSTPNLTLVKAAPSPALAIGTPSTYVLTVTNSGSAAATTAQVKDQLPTGLSFVSASGNGWSCANASGLVTCTYSGSIAASGGTSTINVVTIPKASIAGQTVTNYATVDRRGGANAPPPGPAACAEAGGCSSVSTPVKSPALSIVKSQPSPALEVGRQSTYVLTVDNASTTLAATAQVKDLLPNGLTFVSASGVGWSCGSVGQLVTCNFSGALRSGGPSTISVVVEPTLGIAGTSITNFASIDPTGGNSAPLPGSACATAGSCAQATSTVSNTKGRTEAIVQNFMAKRGDRLATNGLELNRLVTRVADDGCDGGAPAAGFQPSQMVGLAGVPLGQIPDTRSASGGVSGGRGLNGGAIAAQDPAAPVKVDVGSDDRGSISATGHGPIPVIRAATGAPSGIGLGPIANGTSEQGRFSFSGSLAELRRATDAATSVRSGVTTTGGGGGATSCAEKIRQTAFDVWFEGTYDYFSYDHSSGYFGLFKAGADYKVGSGFIVGLMAQLDYTMDKSAELGYLVKGSGWMAGPYAALRLGSNLFLDGRVLWGLSSNDVAPYETFSDTFTTQRALAAIRLSGRWDWNGITLMPSAEYVHFEDKSSAFVNAIGLDIGAQKVTIDRMIIGPELRYSSLLSNGSSIDAHVAVKALWDMSPVPLYSLDGTAIAERRSNLHGRLDLGASLRTVAGTTFGVGGSLEGLGGDGYSSKSVYGTAKLPLQGPN